MSSPITFSGFNQIDFNVVLNAIMQQESQPLQALQAQQDALKATDSAFATLATKLDALQTAAEALAKPSAVQQYAATSSDPAVTATASSGAVAGQYDIVVNELARAQVTASSSTSPDTDTTVVATGGTLTIGGVAVTISGNVTLRQLADQINATAGIPATAGIIQTAPGAYRLLLTGTDTGASHAFTITNGLTGASVAFTDTDGNGISGDSTADNAVQATDASVLINNIAVTSASNTLDSAIPGVHLALLQKDPAKTVVVAVARNDQAIVDGVTQFVSAYNDLVKFASDQRTAATKGTAGTLARDPVLRGLQSALRDALTAAYGSGAFTHLAEIGLGFSRTGELTLDEKTLDSAVATDASGVQQLLSASGGAFASIDALITQYTQAGGLVPGARTRLSDELNRLGKRIDDMQAQLAIRRAALQQEFIAADQAMSRLNSQSGAIASFGSSLTASNL